MTDTSQLSLVPLLGFPLVEAGDDVGNLIASYFVDDRSPPSESAVFEIQADDILIVTHKIVSKAENRFVDLRTVQPSDKALELAAQTGKDPRVVEVIIWDTSEVIRARPGVLIVRHRLGFISANAGVDLSNVGDSNRELALRLPVDPDQSARRIRSQLAERTGKSPAVVMSDSQGRPWREGTVGVAIGVAGLAPVQDLRGDTDLYGRELAITQVGLADQLAAVASLVSGQADEGIPVVLVRGMSFQSDEEATALQILRPRQKDLFCRPE